MARVTVEDCVEKIPNRFELVALAAQRARHISAGAALTVDRDNDKNPVVSLREIADQTVDLPELKEDLIKSLQRHVEQDEPADEDPDVASLGEGLGAMKPEDAIARKTLLEEEIADDILTVGEDAIEAGAEISDSGDNDAAGSGDEARQD